MRGWTSSFVPGLDPSTAVTSATGERSARARPSASNSRGGHESSDSTKITASRVGGAAPGGYSIAVQNLASGDQWSYAFNPPAAATSFTINMPGGVSQQVDLAAGQIQRGEQLLIG